jgi:hypothetical protein
MTREGAPEGNKNAVTHGAYAFRDHGEQALEPAGRTRLAELREVVQDRQGLLSVMQEKCADGILLFELVQSYVASEVKKGVPLAEIDAMKSLPAFYNSMQRAMATLMSLMPANGAPASAELERIQKVIDGHGKDKDAE